MLPENTYKLEVPFRIPHPSHNTLFIFLWFQRNTPSIAPFSVSFDTFSVSPTRTGTEPTSYRRQDVERPLGKPFFLPHLVYAGVPRSVSRRQGEHSLYLSPYLTRPGWGTRRSLDSRESNPGHRFRSGRDRDCETEGPLPPLRKSVETTVVWEELVYHLGFRKTLLIPSTHFLHTPTDRGHIRCKGRTHS